MRKIILCVLLFASFIFALNCEPLTDEQKETMEREHFTEIPAVINSGIMCENGFYYNATIAFVVDICKAFNNKTRTETTISNVLDKRRKTEYTYDEFWIAVKESNEFTSQTCADLYKQFKKEMK
jgi:hypothetical protein